MTDNDDLLDRLDQDFAPGWIPQPGDKIAGRITDITHRDGGWGLYPIVELDLGAELQARTANGLAGPRIAVHATHSVLKNELEQRRPAIGDRLAIKYLGKQGGKNGGAEYEAYKIAHEPANGASAWGGTPTPATAPPASAARPVPEDEEPF